MILSFELFPISKLFKRANPTGYPSQVSRAFFSNPYIMHDLSCHHYHAEHAFSLIKKTQKNLPQLSS
jgi:hypothetical protein